MKTFVLSLSDPAAALENVGGKGMSLSKLARAGLPVPGGFHLTTETYRQFVAANDLQPRILAALQVTDPARPETLETASVAIGERFEQAKIPSGLADAIITAYAALGKDLPVAVRSSATAEDLPGASFAGQQETYLNIQGNQALLQAVKLCWASLWTGRAIAYRARQAISPESVALAVVVQLLVPAEAAGVLFTANPLTGQRSEALINASWGLGEAVVSGLVTPDTLTVNSRSGKVIRRQTAEKSIMTIRTATGTTEQPVPTALKKKPVLTNAQAAELARTGAQIESLYGIPMDIEWALAGGKFAILQARPVTSLPPAWDVPKPKVTYARGSFAEFIPEPTSPLFATLAIPIAQKSTLVMMNEFLGIDNPDTYQFEVINGYVYAGIPMSFNVMWPMIKNMLTASKKMLIAGKERWLVIREEYCKVADKWAAQDVENLPAVRLLEGVREIFTATAQYYTVVQSGTIPSASSSEISFSRFYKSLVKRKHDPEGASLLFGLENQALKAEKSLFDLAAWLRQQPELLREFNQAPTRDVVSRLAAPPDGTAWDALRTRFAAHLVEFGHSLFDLDFSRPLPQDNPAPLVEAIRAHLDGTGSNPYERQRQADERRQATLAEMTHRLDPLRRKWFFKLFNWAVSTAPLREDSIADLGLGYPQIHRLLAELGRRLVEKNAISSVGDVYWLRESELQGLAMKLDRSEVLEDIRAVAESREAEWQRQRRIIPPSVLPRNSWMARLMPSTDQQGSTLKGYAASAGKVTAPACVMTGPDDFGRMKPGAVIVAVTTTPAWTPLFTLASAVVTDIGGPLSHSSIVAREYGIPAVLATGAATRRIQDGQTITVDGSAGTVSIHSNGDS